MAKLIRSTYPREMSIGIVIIIFVLTFFLAGQLFENKQPEFLGFMNLRFAEFLVSLAVLTMVLILWEEILFPVVVKPTEEGLIFRNHKTKLWVQGAIYLVIPIIVAFVYLNYNVNPFRFFGWAAVCLIAPVAGKLISGINNYNDFLKFSANTIAYKNNEKEGAFSVADIQEIERVIDEHQNLHKVNLTTADGSKVAIDLDEMELEAYFDTIDAYILENYKSLLKG